MALMRRLPALVLVLLPLVPLMRRLLALRRLVALRRLLVLMLMLMRRLPARLLTLALALKPLQTRNFYLGD